MMMDPRPPTKRKTPVAAFPLLQLIVVVVVFAFLETAATAAAFAFRTSVASPPRTVRRTTTPDRRSGFDGCRLLPPRAASSSDNGDGGDDETGERDSATNVDDGGGRLALSNRGRGLGSLRDDLDVFEAGMSDAYHPVTNPTGCLVMLVAENKLLLPELRERLLSLLRRKGRDDGEDDEEDDDDLLPDRIFGYGDFGGDVELRRVLAENVMSRFVGEGAVVDPRALRLQCGAGSVLNSLSLVLGDPGDGVLVAGPTYPAFPADFELIGRMKLRVVPTSASERYVPSVESLEEAHAEAVRAGNPPRILLLCQPSNPTGIVHTRSEMTEMIGWALSKPGLHVVSDEIYALSVFPGIEFTSAASILRERHDRNHHHRASDSIDEEGYERYLGDRVHIVYGLSKDWGMSGFRVGVLFSHNEAVLEAFDTLGYYQGVSRHTEDLMIRLFSDDDDVGWIDRYVEENRRRLLENYEALEEALDSIGVTVPVPPGGSHFAWADFSTFLSSSSSSSSERDLHRELFRDAGILLTTGESCFGDKPGMFRIVHPWPVGGPVAMAELKRRLIRWKANRDSRKKEQEETTTTSVDVGEEEDGSGGGTATRSAGP